MRFTKMHGLGNDYIYVNCLTEKIDKPSELAAAISDRHTGIGSDGLILMCPSEKADVRMRIFNADGSEAEMCGNGIRCAAKYAYEHKLAKPAGPLAVPGQVACPVSMNIETVSGNLTVGLMLDRDGNVKEATVNMGRPILKPKQIPVEMAGEKIIAQPIQAAGKRLVMTVVSMGNPHCVFFCDDVSEIELEKIGPAVENHRIFPNRTNVHFVHVNSPTDFSMRTWERGSGSTMACGTGACASLAAAVLTGRTKRQVTAHLPGGELTLSWSDSDDCIYMTGPAVEVFEGRWLLK